MNNRAIDSQYNIRSESAFPYWTLAEGAKKLKLSTNRLSRILRILAVPVYRKGYTIFLDRSALHTVERAIQERAVRPGRKKKSGP